MKRFGRALAAAFGIVVLTSVVSLVPQKSATADGGAPVNIISPLPLPVTGTVGVNNFPATQNVSITNPSVPVSGSVNANVTFPSNLPIHNLDDPGRIPYQSVVDMTGKCPATTGPPEPNCFFNFPLVAAGHRLVVQHVSGIIQVTGLPPAISVGFVVPGLSPSSVSFLVPFVNLNGIVLSEFDQQVLVFYDQNRAPTVLVTPGSGTFVNPNNIQLIALTGYLLDCSVADCEPIAK